MVEDHKGNRFSSIGKMCGYWGISRNTYYSRIKSGWTMEQALSTERQKKMIKVKGEDGREYRSLSAYCKGTGKSVWAIERRYKKAVRSGGIDNIDLVSGANESFLDGRCKNVVDHLGNKFRSETDMCKHYGVQVCTFRKRRAKGNSLEVSLYNGNLTKTGKIYYDHLGNSYFSLKSLCETYNISTCTYLSRVKTGWSIEKALTVPVKVSNSIDDIIRAC